MRALVHSLSVGDLVAHLNIWPRTPARRFADQRDTSPGTWLLFGQVAEARTLLEVTYLSVEAIAARVGLTSAGQPAPTLPHPGGQIPSAFRRAFRAHDRPDHESDGQSACLLETDLLEICLTRRLCGTPR